MGSFKHSIVTSISVLVFITGVGVITKLFEPTIVKYGQDGKHQELAQWNLERLQDPETGKIPEGIIGKSMMFAKMMPKEPTNSRNDASKLDYKERGPFNVGGRTRAVAYDVNNLQTLIAGGVNGGIWKSTDHGNTWKFSFGNDQMHNITALTQDTRSGKTKTWYAGTGEGSSPSSNHHGSAAILGNGMYKSTDNGDTWEHLSSTAINKVNHYSDWSFIWNIAIDPSNSTEEEVYAAVNGAIMKTTDGGTTWKKVLGGGGLSDYAWVQVTSTGVVYAAIGGNTRNIQNFGFWRSTDGDNWTNIGSGNIPNKAERIIFDVAASNEKKVFILMYTPGVGSPVNPNQPNGDATTLLKYEYLSGNGAGTGGKYTNLSGNLPKSTNPYYTFDCQYGYNMAIKVKPNKEDVVFIGGTNLFRSTNGFSNTFSTVQIGGYNPKPFTNFEEYRYPNQHPDQHLLVFRGQSNNELLSATDGGLHFTNNCMASEVIWEWKNNGYHTAQFYTCAVAHDSETDVIVGGTQDNGSQYTNSASKYKFWVDPLKSDGSHCAVGPNTGKDGEGIYYVSSQRGNIYKVKMNSSGTRDSYQRINYPGTNANYQFIHPYALDYNNRNVMFLPYRQNNGQTVLKRNTQLQNIPLNNSRAPSAFGWTDMPVLINEQISVLTPTQNNPKDRLYIGTRTNQCYRVDNSTGNNPTVTKMSIQYPFKKGSFVSDIAVHPEDGNKILLSFSNFSVYSIYYSEDGGDTWEGVAGNLEDTLETGMPEIIRGIGNGPSVRSLAIAKTKDGITYFAATNTGLYATYKLDGINTVWIEQASDVIGNTVVEYLDLRSSDNTMAIATHGKGMYSVKVKNSIPDGILENEIEKQQEELTAFPNPASNQTTLSINTLVKQDFYVVKVYDRNGRMVQKQRIETLANQSNSSTFNLNISSLTKGMYFVNVKGGEFDRTTKLVVK